MSRSRPSLWEPDLERELLRQGVVRLAAGRSCCADCGRTPLIGEQVHVYGAHAVVCELCRPGRRAAPESIQTVRHSEHGHAVRLLPVAA